jgi:sigma-E factor negative regulatory protein RseB
VLGALLMLAWLPIGLHAETLQPADPVAWLQKVANAAHQFNYSGTFVYQHGGQVETSRITHRFDESGEQEKLEALDGPLREIIRNNNEVLCYYSVNKTVKVEKRHAQKYFPALLPARAADLAENYTVKLGEQERVAGYDCQAIILEPKDALRYGHKFWADVDSGLLLKASVIDEKGQVLHQFAFTQVTIGGQIDKERLKPHLSARKAPDHADHPAVSQARLSETGWEVRQPPAGFKKIMELQRSMPGRNGPVAHLVLSDGLAAISVFIEPLAGMEAKPMEGVFAQGPINVYAKPVDNHQVTVLGEVPSGAVMQVANSVVPKAK